MESLNKIFFFLFVLGLLQRQEVRRVWFLQALWRKKNFVKVKFKLFLETIIKIERSCCAYET